MYNTRIPTVFNSEKEELDFFDRPRDSFYRKDGLTCIRRYLLKLKNSNIGDYFQFYGGWTIEIYSIARNEFNILVQVNFIVPPEDKLQNPWSGRYRYWKVTLKEKLPNLSNPGYFNKVDTYLLKLN